MNESALFSLHDISKSYGKHQILQALSLELFDRDISMLLGRNGAGKTTLLRLCASLARPDSGLRRFSGKESSVANWGQLELSEFAYVGHSLQLYASYSVRENLQLFAALRGVALAIEEYLSKWELERHAAQRVCDLSRGLQYRAALCVALLHRPAILLLDEPSSSLDDAAVLLLQDFLSEILSNSSKPTAVLIATHDVERFRGWTNRVLLLDAGSITQDSRASSSQDVIDYYRTKNR